MSKNVFLSFVEEDLDLVRLFRGQAKNSRTDLNFADYSVKTPYNSTNAAYIRSRITERISACSVAICLVGHTTSRSEWVDWEMRKAYELGRDIFGVRLHSNSKSDPTPKSLIDLRAAVLNWDITAIVRRVG